MKIAVMQMSILSRLIMYSKQRYPCLPQALNNFHFKMIAMANWCETTSNGAAYDTNVLTPA
jgi:hypothetical protein